MERQRTLTRAFAPCRSAPLRDDGLVTLKARRDSEPRARAQDRTIVPLATPCEARAHEEKLAMRVREAK
jgi:hypothetical protein